MNEGGGRLNWTITVIPVVIVELLLFAHLSWNLFQTMLKNLILSIPQFICLFCYATSIVLFITAEIITCTRDYKDYSTLSTPTPPSSSLLFMSKTYVETVPLILWLIGGVIFTVAGMVIFYRELHSLAGSRGYTEPLPLHRWDIMYFYMCFVCVFFNFYFLCAFLCVCFFMCFF